MKADVLKTVWGKPPGSRDLLLIIVFTIIVFAISAVFDVFNKVITWVYQHDTWQLDEVFTVSIFLVFAIALYAWRRHRELLVQIHRREEAEAEKARIVPELQRALDDVALLRNIVPVCPSCKRVRDTTGEWYHAETYLEIHYPARFNNGLCPSCAKDAYGNANFHLSHRA